MPIVELSDRRRVPRLIQIKLGEPPNPEEKRNFPREVEWFVIQGSGGDNPAAREARKLYGVRPQELRLMLPADIGALSPDGQELVYNLNNRWYGANRGTKCIGTGMSAARPGTARTRDVRVAARIRQVTGGPTIEQEPADKDGYFNLTCWGTDCKKYLTTVEVEKPGGEGRPRIVLERDPDKDKDAGCGRRLVFRFLLLHPETNQESDDYLRVIGGAEIATTSINSIVDIASGADLARTYTGGRTVAIPFTLLRRATITFRPSRMVHHTLVLQADQREAAWAAVRKPHELFLRAAALEEVARIRALGPVVEFDTVADLTPRFAHPEALPAHVEGVEEEDAPPAAPPTGAAGDMDEAMAAAGGDAPPGPPASPPVTDGDDPERWLFQRERDRLKAAVAAQLWPGEPWQEHRGEATRRLVALVKEFDEVFGTTTMSPDGVLGALQAKHLAWLTQRIARLGQPESEGDSAGNHDPALDVIENPPQGEPGRKEASPDASGDVTPPEGSGEDEKIAQAAAAVASGRCGWPYKTCIASAMERVQFYPPSPNDDGLRDLCPAHAEEWRRDDTMAPPARGVSRPSGAKAKPGAARQERLL